MSRRRRGTHIKANAPSQRVARAEAVRLLAAPRKQLLRAVDFYKLALTVEHAGGPAMLRQRAEEVEVPLSKEIREICARMVAVTKRDPHCLGVAAPQVNRSLRIFTVKDNDGMVYCFVNPTVTPRPGSLRQAENEGCFSMPGRCVHVERWTAVEVEGLAPFGGESRMVFTGMAARAAQHEAEHLDGLLIDTHGPVKKIA